MALESIKYRRGSLQILNQLQLPSQTVYEEISTVEDGWNAIKQMKVRGAPAIAMVGCLSLVADLHDKEFETSEELITRIENDLEYLVSARPTAVNMKKTADLLITYAKEVAAEDQDPFILKEKIVTKVEYLLEKDVADNKNIGDFGSEHIQDNPDCEKGGDGKVTVLTHCNTGSLATAKYGTALGVIRSLHDSGNLDHVYFTETRPYNQGARLTAYELVHEKIPATLIADSMAALLMKAKTVSAVVVGADRVAMNGDTANKIGTYQLAIAAKHHGIPFYIASPFSSIDRNTKTGEEIVIEERPPEELTYVNGLKIAADGVECWNPAFDVTPYELITGGIITEFGVLKREELLDKLAHTDS